MLLDRVSAHVVPGRIIAVLGPNGAGKSTLIKAMAGELPVTEGRLSMDGQSITGLSPRDLARRRAVLPQTSLLDFGFSVAEVVALGRIPLAGTTDARDDTPAIEAARQATDIVPLWGRRYPTLSGGEQQRVHMARVLAQLWRPHSDDGPHRYLFLDEPTAALDLRHRRAILDIARQLARQGVGVMMAVHDLNLAAAYADDIVLMRQGQVMTAGSCADVLDQPQLEACFDSPVEVIRRSGMPTVFLT